MRKMWKTRFWVFCFALQSGTYVPHKSTDKFVCGDLLPRKGGVFLIPELQHLLGKRQKIPWVHALLASATGTALTTMLPFSSVGIFHRMQKSLR